MLCWVCLSMTIIPSQAISWLGWLGECDVICDKEEGSSIFFIFKFKWRVCPWQLTHDIYKYIWPSLHQPLYQIWWNTKKLQFYNFISWVTVLVKKILPPYTFRDSNLLSTVSNFWRIHLHFPFCPSFEHKRWIMYWQNMTAGSTYLLAAYDLF